MMSGGLRDEQGAAEQGAWGTLEAALCAWGISMGVFAWRLPQGISSGVCNPLGLLYLSSASPYMLI